MKNPVWPVRRERCGVPNSKGDTVKRSITGGSEVRVRDVQPEAALLLVEHDGQLEARHLLAKNKEDAAQRAAMERIIEARKRARGGFLGPLRTGQDRYVEPENRWGAVRWWLVASSLFI